MSLALAVLFLLSAIRSHGIWDPHELERAELARRIAIALFDSPALSVDGAANGYPTLTDLGMGELGATSMAWGFAQFGLADFAGRLPLACWAILGAAALFALLARFVSVRAGLAAVAALVTMPLYFLQARTMLGDAVAMAAFSMALCGLLGALLERAIAWRLGAWLVLAACGLGAGFLSRGLALGVAVPCFGVAGAWLVVTAASPAAGVTGQPLSGALNRDTPRRAVGVAVAVVGLVALAWVAFVLHAQRPGEPLSRVLGVALVSKPSTAATFDLTLRDLGHALFPWSAFLPFALARMFVRRNAPATGSRSHNRTVVIALLLAAAAAFAVHAWLAPHTGPLPFVAPAALAGVVGVAVHDAVSERGAGIVAVGTVVLSLLLLRDFRTTPLKALAGYGLGERAASSDFQLPEVPWLLLATTAFAVIIFFTWLETDASLDTAVRSRSTLRDWLRGRIERYEGCLRQLSLIWAGNLAFGFLLVEAAMVGLAVTMVVGRRAEWEGVMRMSQPLARACLNVWWVVPLVLALVVPLLDLARLAFAFVLHRFRLPRAFGTVLAGLLAGGLLSFGFYSDVAAQLSPKGVFERYAALRQPGESLGLLGVSTRMARYYAQDAPILPQTDGRTAAHWLLQDNTGPRRWLMLREQSLAEANAAHRKRVGTNLPVVEAPPGRILLASNKPGTRSLNPLNAWVMDTPPARIQHPVDASLDGKLQALGWEVSDEAGTAVPFVVPGRMYTMRFFYRVLTPLRRNYRAFLHVDRGKLRHNGDHDVLGGRYRVGLWQPGDIVVDRYDMTLEPNFLPERYRVFYGLFSGKKRLPVTRGKHHDNRIDGGVLVVR